MAEITGILGAPDPAAGEDTSRGLSLIATLGRLSGMLLSAVWPGAGHLALGQLSKGMVLSALFVGLLCGFWPLRLLRYYPGLIALFGGWVVLGLYSVCSTQLIRNPRTGHRPSIWWFVFTVPAALFIVSLTGAGVTRASGFRSFSVPSASMEPTIQHGDGIVVDDHAFRSATPQYRDVIVCYKNGAFVVKRIIGMGGDTIEGRTGGVLLNGTLMSESYIQHSRTQPRAPFESSGDDWMQSFGPVAIPMGKYFVLGDNRDVSLDSRWSEFGFVERGSIVGKVLYVYRSAREGARVR